MQLPITLEPYSTETLRGYLLRLSAANYYKQPSWLLGLLETDAKDTNLKDWTFVGERLSEIIRQTQIPASSLAYQVSEEDTRVSFGPHQLPRQLLQLDRNSICPLCVKELGHIQSLWDIKVVRCCPRHNIPLLDECADCGKPLSWRRPDLLTCSCYSDFGSQVPEATPPKHLVNMAAIVSYFIASPYNLPRDALSAHWAETSSSDFFDNLHLLLSTLNTEPNWVKDFKDKALSELVATVEPVFSDWPQGFELYLGRLMRRDLLLGNAFSLRGTSLVTRLYQSVHSGEDSKRFIPLRDGFDQVVYGDLFGKSVAPQSTSSSPSPDYLTLAEVHEELDICDGLPQLLSDLRIFTHNQIVMRGRRHYRFTAKDTGLFKTNSSVTVDIKALASVLAVSKKAVGVLLSAISNANVHIGYRTISFNIQALDKLLRRLRSVDTPIYVSEAWYVNLGSAFRVADQLGLAAEQLAQAIHSGRLKTRQRPPHGSRRRFALYHYWDLLLLRHPQAQVSTGLAAQTLGVGTRLISKLAEHAVDLGLLEVVGPDVSYPIKNLLQINEAFTRTPIVYDAHPSPNDARRIIDGLPETDVIRSTNTRPGRYHYVATKHFHDCLSELRPRTTGRKVPHIDPFILQQIVGDNSD